MCVGLLSTLSYIPWPFGPPLARPRQPYSSPPSSLLGSDLRKLCIYRFHRNRAGPRKPGHPGMEKVSQQGDLGVGWGGGGVRVGRRRRQQTPDSRDIPCVVFVFVFKGNRGHWCGCHLYCPYCSNSRLCIQKIGELCTQPHRISDFIHKHALFYSF